MLTGAAPVDAVDVPKPTVAVASVVTVPRPAVPASSICMEQVPAALVVALVVAEPP